MRAITKLPEPVSLTRHRANTHTGYGNLPAETKQDLRDQLVKEQRGICCYCCSRIRPEVGGMKIEHWKSQSEDKYPQNQLDYWNLLGACMGNEGQPDEMQYCDTHKRDDDLARNPSNPAHQIEEVIQFLSDGSIRSTDAALDAQLGEEPRAGQLKCSGVLNLNLAFLKNNRKAVLNAFHDGLRKRGKLGEGELERLLAKWRGDDGGLLDPYSPVVVFWLKKRLKRH